MIINFSANEGVQAQTSRAIRSYAHDRYKPIRLAERPSTRNQTRDPHFLQPRKQFVEDIPSHPLQGKYFR